MKKISLFIIVLLSAGFFRAQDKSTLTFTFDHLALSVKDVDRSAEFYKTVLNLQEITNRTEIPGIRWFSFGEGKELHLISIISEEVTLNKAVHLALTSPSFDEFLKVLEKLNVQYSDWPGTPNTVNMRTDGIKQIYFQDPDGYWIEVNNVAQMK
jgi:catechol 2,3-dioxygenase-like lactoylglutathione lyase family enzyme